MVGEKFTEAVSTEWASPIVLNQKNDGLLRLCVDYYKLNAVTIRDSYSVPCRDECFDSSAEVIVF